MNANRPRVLTVSKFIVGLLAGIAPVASAFYLFHDWRRYQMLDALGDVPERYWFQFLAGLFFHLAVATGLWSLYFTLDQKGKISLTFLIFAGISLTLSIITAGI